jgi:PAS domain S-box-containing protein
MTSPPRESPATPSNTGETHLRLINRINALILGGGDLDSILASVVEVTRDVMEVERASVLLLDPVSGNLRVRAAHGIPRGEWDKIAIPLGKGIAGRVALEGLPMMSSDIRQTDLPAKGGRDYADNSFISAPLTIQERVLGVLNINNRTDGSPLGENDLQLALAVAAMVSLAVENANLLANAISMQEHFRDVLSNLKHGVVCADAMASITLCNPVAGRLLGVSPDQIVGRELLPTMPMALQATLKRLMTESRDSRQHAEQEVDLPGRGGGLPLPVWVTVGTLRDSNGMIDAVIVVLEDLSLRREVEELRRLDELKSSFLALVSHELRTPLTSIKGAVHLLEGDMAENAVEQRRPLYELIRKNTDRLVTEVNNILDVNQLEHRTMTVFPREQDFTKLIEMASESMRRDFEQRHVNLDVEKRDLAPMAVDTERIAQLLRLLLDNALKFTPNGGSVRLWTEPRRGGGAIIHIRDSGVGVPEEQRDKVFAKFYQLEHTLTRRSGGSGLGLYLARGIVELHGGTIAFRSIEGPGAEVVVEIPQRPPA